MFLMQNYNAMKYLMMLTLLILSSCSKDINPIDDVTSKNPFDYLSDADKEDRTNQIMDYLEPGLDTDYKKSFLIANIPDDLRKAKPNELEVRFLRIAATADKIEMQKQYGMVKTQLQEWLSENSNEQYSSTIQFVSLRYLRRLFLEENSAASKKETKFLLEILLDLKAEDLDVLADAYHKVKSDLDGAQQRDWFNYLKTVYDKNIQLINNKGPEYKAAYENAKYNIQDRFKYRRHIIGLETRWKSCVHANDLLNFRTQN